MIYQYNEIYLDDAMSNLGEALDYAFYSCKLSPKEFMDYFVTSGYSKQFEVGNPKIICGISGTELVLRVLESSNLLLNDIPKPRKEYAYTPEYYAGYILAYFTFKTSISFKNIIKTIPIDEIINMYPLLHETSNEKAINIILNIYKKRLSTANLKIVRKASGMTQKELSIKSNVSLRSIQQYEQKVKNINKASIDALLSLSIILGCNVEDLLEKV
jgi:DNA-binding transcriptional regulator YiaG